jgi:hypothetical protein
MERTILIIATFCLCFVSGFLISLGLHWQIRPDGNSGDFQRPKQVAAEPVIVETNINLETLKTQVADLERQFDQQQALQSVEENHARTTVSQLTVYRDNKAELIEKLVAQKQQLIDKLGSLDAKIAEQLARQEQTSPVSKAELINELSGLLHYPHSLNDDSTLNQLMLEQPQRYAALVRQRFEMLLMPEQFELAEKLRKEIDETAAKVLPTLQINQLRCTDEWCEIQLTLVTENPYQDYWQQWLDQLQQLSLAQQIEHQVNRSDGTRLSGSVIVKVEAR